jgi:XTP/dITP diphosphohydrolase
VTKLLLASRNAKKLRELQRIVAAEGLSGISVLGLADVPSFPEAPETAPDFEGNALAKARDAAAATGLPSVADDSGIEIDALNGMPGVLSARWSGRHGDDEGNIDLVLGQLGDVPDERRGGAFVSVVALSFPVATRSSCVGSGAGRFVGSDLARTGSATTRSSSPRGTTSRRPR